jgi:hypothetical protein
MFRWFFAFEEGWAVAILIGVGIWAAWDHSSSWLTFALWAGAAFYGIVLLGLALRALRPALRWFAIAPFALIKDPPVNMVFIS